MAAPPTSSSRPSSAPAKRQHALHKYSDFWFAVAVTTFVVTTVGALLQKPSDPDEPVRFSTLAGWLRPIGADSRDQLQADLQAVSVSANGAEVWVAGNSGLIAHSTDGGVSWTKMPRAARERGVAATQTDTASDPTLTDTSATTTVSVDTSATDTSVPFSTDTMSTDTTGTGTATDTSGTGAFTTTETSATSGTTTTRLRHLPPRREEFFSLVPAAYAQGTMPAPRPSLPRLVTLPVEQDFIAIDRVGATIGVISSIGDSFSSVDGGITWQHNPGAVPFDPQYVPYRDVGVSNGNIYMLVDGEGAPETEPNRRRSPGFRINACARDEDAYVSYLAGERGRVERSIPYGDDDVLTAPTPVDLHAIYALGTTIWVGGEGGAIFRHDGRTWQRAQLRTTATIRGIHFIDERRGWAVGDRGVVLRTSDGGLTWTKLTREWEPGRNNGTPAGPWPPPWYLVLNAFVTIPALAAAARARPRDEHTSEQTSIADSLTSDRALEKGDPDAMNLGAIALALSRFFRNENTVPPLTVAVTGEWGSGKSSLMNLLRADLVDFGFRPVWFNAWHNQKEEHLLASLLQSIRLQALPQWWRPENWTFRLRLIWIRGWRRRVTLLVLIVVLALALGYDSVRREHREPGDATAVKNLDLRELPKKLGDEFALLLSLGGLAVAAYQGLNAFGVNPAKLLAAVSASAKVSDLDAQMSFRHRFAAEFRDVTKALGARSLLIFIDDLDRCQPDSVREVLEAVNFLVTSGDCFVVLGIDRMRVERYLTISYGKIAEGEPDFAAKYLDKLINIEVPVPSPDAAQSGHILNPRVVSHPQNERRFVRALFRAAQFWPLAAAFLVFWAAFQTGKRIPHRDETAPASTQATMTATTAAAATSTTSTAAPITTTETTGTFAGPAPAPDPVPPRQPARVVAGTRRSHLWLLWWPALLLLPLVAVAWWLLTRPRELVIRDSPEFAAAIEIWQTVIAARYKTPRALKRFMNRLRYLAMLQRPQTEAPTLGRALRARLFGVAPTATPVPPGPVIPESALVALAAMPVATVEASSEVVDAKTKHVERFANEPEQWRGGFVRLAAGVRVN